jgi:hypothetical protein
MSKTAAISLILCLSTVAGVAQARPDAQTRTWNESQNQQRNTDAQRRRADLRAAVQARPDEPVPSNQGTAAVRQLTQQERRELRLQLRQAER